MAYNDLELIADIEGAAGNDCSAELHSRSEHGQRKICRAWLQHDSDCCSIGVRVHSGSSNRFLPHLPHLPGSGLNS